MLKQFLPYVVPLLVVLLILRRSRRARRVSMTRMWILPVILTLMTGVALAAAPMPGPVALAGFVAAAVAGAGLGYLRARHQQLTIDPQTGRISSQATMIGTLLILGLFVVRFGMKLVFPQMARPGHGGEVAVITNGLLIFTVVMLIVQSASLWTRTRPLLAEHAARTNVTPVK